MTPRTDLQQSNSREKVNKKEIIKDGLLNILKREWVTLVSREI